MRGRPLVTGRAAERQSADPRRRQEGSRIGWKRSRRMGSIVQADVRPVARPGPEATIDRVRLWLLPSPAPVDHGAFDRALRAAGLAWQPRRIEPREPPVAAGPVIGLPEVLDAWRATERELACMTGDDPVRELLEANVTLLRAMYQRLFRERMQR